MVVVVRKASRKNAKMRCGIAATAGAGKTMGALLVAYGLTGDWDKVGLIDTEAGSGELYVNHPVPGTNIIIGEFQYVRIDPPYTVIKYIESQKALEDAGCEAIIHDSTSHAWSGAGGLLDKQGRIAAKSGNSYTAWRDVTPDHNLFVETMLNSPAHIIATMRSKTEYVLEKDSNGKMVPRKIGMAPVQREGMDFEFTVMMDIDAGHMASATKDRTSLFDGEYFKLSPDTGKKMLGWLNLGAPMMVAREPEPPPEPKKRSLREWLGDLQKDLEFAQDAAERDAILAREDVQKASSSLQGSAQDQLSDMIQAAMARFPDDADLPSIDDVKGILAPAEDDGWPGPTPESIATAAE